jgi:hypothetical protein
MKLKRGPFPIDVARELVEEALILAARNADVEVRAAFNEEKQAAESIETVDIREKHLDALDGHWMDRLHVAAALESVLARHRGVESVISRCFLKLARAKEHERAFLYADGRMPHGVDGGRPALVVELTPETLLAAERLESLLMTTLAKARRPS